MIEHHLFPTLVCQFKYDDHENFKQNFYKNIWNHMTEDGYSNEYTGHLSIHHEPSFEPLFRYASKCAKEYMRRLNIDDVFDLNLTKTWLNMKRQYATPTHMHGDAHISFSYYVNVPLECYTPIRFHNYTNRHEPYPGCIRWNNSQQNWDMINSYSWQFEIMQGDLMVFPSTLVHDTIGEQMNCAETASNVEELEKTRLCLAGDFILTYKEKTPSALGVQPLENWRRFT